MSGNVELRGFRPEDVTAVHHWSRREGAIAGLEVYGLHWEEGKARALLSPINSAPLPP